MPKRFDMMAYIRDNDLQTAVGKACGIDRRAVWQWTKVPPLRVLTVEKLTGIPRHKIRPDLYPPEREARDSRAA